MALPYTKFKGKLHGEKAENFIKKLDFSLKQNDRIKFAQELMKHPYWSEYFDTYYKSNISQNDNLSDHVSVCQTLDSIANYILFSPDGERINKKVKYNFYTERNFNKLLCKESSIESKAEDSVSSFDVYDGDEKFANQYSEVINYLVRPMKNYKNKIAQEIFDKDLSNEYLKSYQDAIWHCKLLYCKYTEQIEELNKQGKSAYKIINKRKFLTKHMKEMKLDQLISKDMLFGTIYFKQPLPDSCDTDYDQFDFFDESHIRALLCVKNTDLQTDVGCLVWDLKNLIKNIAFDPLENEIINLLKNDNTNIEIADILGIKRQYIDAKIQKIAKKIINEYYIVYEDWYYLNICKGKYKQCSKCGQIKLATDTYFSFNKSQKDGFDNICKQCRINYNNIL